MAGRAADRRGLDRVISVGAFSVLFSWMIFGGWNTLPGLIFGTILLDFGVQSAVVAHQQIIYLQPETRNRVNTLFMVGIFTFGSVGSAGAMLARKLAAWQGIACFAISLAILASILSFLKQVRP